MKKFLQKSLIIFSPILITLICMEISLRNIPNDYKLKADYLNTNSSEIENLILGSSHSFFGINPTYFDENTFNLSHVSQSLDYDYRLLAKYENKLTSLKRIYLPISYFSLWGKLANGKENWRVKSYSAYKLDSGLNLDKLLITDSFESNIKKIIKYYFLGKSNITSSSLGWGTTYHSTKAKNLKKTGKLASQRHTKDINSSSNQEIYSKNIMYITQIIKIAKSNKIEVVLFTPPAYITYRDNVDSIQLKKTISLAQQFAHEFSNCEYINLFTSPEFSKEDYYDADHLSEIGSKKLSILLNNNINLSN